MNRTQLPNELGGLKYVALVNLLSFIAVSIVLIFISGASLVQTISAFRALEDAELVVAGVSIGLFLPIAYGVLFQYGKNVALYIRKYYCDTKTIFIIPFVEWRISTSSLAMFAFWVCAIVDAATNVLWFYRNVEMTGDPIVDGLVVVTGYPAMIGIVFVEELLGIVFQGLRRSFRELKSINEREKAQGTIDQQRSQYSVPVERPVFKNTIPNPTYPKPSSYPKPRPTYHDLNDLFPED
jgi:hypothetical protein